jgi:glycosyltransferase involved in cell wall biosynthesis
VYTCNGLIANIVHISLNARGGAERLAISTIKALSSMGIDIELHTFEKPDLLSIRQTYGESIEKDVKKIRTLNILGNACKGKYDVTINTHGDMLPFFQKDFGKNNAIVYCHFPMAGYLLDCHDNDYANMVHTLSLSSMAPEYCSHYLREIKSSYRKMLSNCTVITNSEFSRKTISKTYGVESRVLHPPVDVDTFRRVSLPSRSRDNLILVVSRFHPSKKIENAIYLAYLLKRNSVGKRMDIVGNISDGYIRYYNYLCHLVKFYKLEQFVRFEVNVKFERLLDLMRRAKAYVHPLPGEPFGISTVEAMSAGIIPVVPNLGGHAEFVPPRYQFHTFGQGVEAVALALDAPASERIKISNSIQKFSIANYIKKFQHVLSELVDCNRASPRSTPIISVSKRLSESMTA